MDYPALLTAIADAHQQAQAGAAGAVNRQLILRNWLIGAHLVEFEQRGGGRAKYGAGLLKRVATDLRARNIPGCAVRMLERMRVFYLNCPQLREMISSPVMTISRNLLPAARPGISSSVMTKSTKPGSRPNPRPLSADVLLQFSWTHLIDLLAIDDPWKRAFYENECLKGHWSVRQLQRQIGSLLFERTGLSTDKQAVIERAREQAIAAPGSIADLIRDPYGIRHRRSGSSTVRLTLPCGPAQARAVAATHRNRPRCLGTAPSRIENRGMTMLSEPVCLRVKGPFACYGGPFRDGTAPCATGNHVIPASLKMMFGRRQNATNRKPS